MKIRRGLKPMSWGGSVVFITYVGGYKKKIDGRRMLVTEFMVEVAKEIQVFSVKEIQNNN